MSAPSRRPIQSDLRRRTGLAIGQIRPIDSIDPSSSRSGENAGDDASADAVLDQMSEQLNARVDAEVETLAKNMLSIVELGQIGDKDPFKVSQDAFEVETRTENMIRAAENLLSLSHTLKLLFLLNDDANVDASGVEDRQEDRQNEERRIEDLKQQALQRAQALVQAAA